MNEIQPKRPAVTIAGVQRLQTALAQWGYQTFPEHDVSVVLDNLRRGVDEWRFRPDNADKLAECFLQMLRAAHMQGFDVRSIYDVACERFAEAQATEQPMVESVEDAYRLHRPVDRN